jgi:hypothetical protein
MATGFEKAKQALTKGKIFLFILNLLGFFVRASGWRLITAQLKYFSSANSTIYRIAIFSQNEL